MCVPSANLAGSILNTAISGAKTISEVSNMKSNYAYQTQIALNNAKNAQNEALRQKQLGIEKSRLEKISGLQEVNKLKAINAANNLDMMSGTSQLSYQDVQDSANNSANSIKSSYDAASESYFARANSYLETAKNYKKEYNKSIFNYSLNALGKMNQVASEWYEERV